MKEKEREPCHGGLCFLSLFFFFFRSLAVLVVLVGRGGSKLGERDNLSEMTGDRKREEERERGGGREGELVVNRPMHQEFPRLSVERRR